jgi:NAD(P)H-hydrate epimerase
MIGVDLVFIPEFQRQLDVGGTDFLQKAFNLSEINNRHTEHLAGLWAAKEAVIKAALKTPRKMTDIIITHDAAGKPSARIKTQQFMLSIAHDGEYAIAVACRVES